jgi:hypothetical protein
MITTPDRRLRVFISSTLTELAEERDASRRAIEQLRLTPIMFEVGARDHSPADVYHSYLQQSDIFLGIYWQSAAWEGVGFAKLYQRDLAAATHAFEMSLASNPIADDKASIATALLGACRLGGDGDDHAMSMIQEAATVIFRRRDWVGQGFLLSGVIPALLFRGQIELARRLMAADFAVARSSPDLRGRCRSLSAAARFHAGLGDAGKATTSAIELLVIRRDLGEDRQIATALVTVAEVLV